MIYHLNYLIYNKKGSNLCYSLSRCVRYFNLQFYKIS